MGRPTEKEVLKYLKEDRTLTGGKILYNQMANKSLAILRSCNTMTDTPDNISRICYELGKLVGLSEREIIIHTSKPVTKEKSKVVVLPTITPKDVPLSQLLLQFDSDTADYHKDVKPLAARLHEELGVYFENQQKETLLQGILATAKAERIKELEAIPLPVKQSLKLNTQFPFLREDNCPDIYKVLVNDMITAYHKYTAAHGLLFEKATQEELAELAATVKDNFIENKQIWEELTYYQENKTPLGKHPLFKQQQFEKEIESLSTIELTKKCAAIANNMNRNKKNAKDESRSQEDREASRVLYQSQEKELALAKTVLAKR